MPLVLKGPVSRQRKKKDLQDIAKRLKISQDGTVPVLVERIKTHLDLHSETLSTQPAFQGLYAYRADGQASGRAPKETTEKTSADKVVEDAEASKAGGTAAG